MLPTGRLTLTAELDHAVAKANIRRPSSSDGNRLSTSSADSTSAASQLPALLAAIDAETRAEDRFQAQVCAAWLLWILREDNAVIARLPRPENDNASLPIENLSEWNKICAVKAALLRPYCLVSENQHAAALNAYEASLVSLNGILGNGPVDMSKQLRHWAELFLTEYSRLTSYALNEGLMSPKDPRCLLGFRAWGKYWEKSEGVLYMAGHGFKDYLPRRQIWIKYYFALSDILQSDLALPPGDPYVPPNTKTTSVRGKLAAEMRRVLGIAQGFLYGELEFPKANEDRTEVEDFVKRVMQDWEILNGRGWKEDDVFDGSRIEYCRSTLKHLYQAASVTYQSTAILRHLFTVHLALAEFDLAFGAFNSWLDIVKRGKARVHKTGHREPALDDDTTMFETISTAIAALCRFGDREAAETAYKLAEELQEMVEKEEARDSHTVEPQSDEVPPSTLALAWQSIGLAQAQWARMSYESELRAPLQEKAVLSLRKSLAPEFGQGVNARGVFALGLLYAEQRQLSAGIELVKTTLLADKPLSQSQKLRLGPYWRERSCIPLWHLLAVMLSARGEFVMAARACEGAFEQFKDPSVLFGARGLNSTYRSEHLNEAEKSQKGGSDGLVDEMDDYEKENILQIKITQLAILEVVEGEAIAVNATPELLSLYARLFGDPEQKPELAKVEPPKSSATTRSFRGSLFGRSDKSRARQSMLPPNVNERTIPGPSRPQTSQTVQGTTDFALNSQMIDGATDPSSSRRSFKSDDFKNRRRNSLRKRGRSVSRQRALSIGSPPVPPLDSDKYFAALDPRHSVKVTSDAPPTLQLDGPRRSSSRSRAATNPADMSATGSFVPLLPNVHFSPEHTHRRRQVILIKVWQIIRALYRRAGAFDEAKKAHLEAVNLGKSLKADVLNDSGVGSVIEIWWGMEKSVEELQADIWAEKGQFDLARGKPYDARTAFETVLTHFPNHPDAIVGLSNILLDIYSEKLPPPPAVPGLDLNKLSHPPPTPSHTRRAPPRNPPPAAAPRDVSTTKRLVGGARQGACAAVDADKAGVRMEQE
ncbi:hypothetical protein N0V88_005942 [Collariella sp. IMI 366227]|nr:hypothetical protein N0V88_005942 [Collariella sp. IMI 366227]